MFNHILRRNRENDDDRRAPTNANGDDRNLTSHQPGSNLVRRNSNETLVTLSTLVNSDVVSNAESRDEDNQSLFTSHSDETVINQVRVFGEPISQFTTIRELPIISTFLQSGVELFESLQSFEASRQNSHVLDGRSRVHAANRAFAGEPCPATPARQAQQGPILSTSTSMMSIFKRQTPFMVINRHGETKYEYCKVHFRVISNHISYYVLDFCAGEGDEFQVVLLNNNSHKPSVDFEYKGTKMRVMGVTGTTSTFGNGLLKIFIMRPECELLSNNVVWKGLRSRHKLQVENTMSNVIETQDRSRINNFMNEQQYLVSVPIATFTDEAVKISNKFVRCGKIKIFGRKKMQDDEFVLICVLLVLREQETRKNKGYGKPTAF